MTTLHAFIKRYPVQIFYAVVFIISWGGFFLIGAPGILAGTSWQTDPRFQIAVLAMLAGPPVAGILLTILVAGKGGLRELNTRLFRWQVGRRWYAVALLLAPFLEMTVLLLLARISPVFLPSIITASDNTGLLVAGVAVGLVGGFIEELGWTGFVIPSLRLRYSVFTTGLIVGVLWGAWHLLQMWWVGSTSAATLPLAFFLPIYFLSAIVTLTAYRVLMVWVYDQTGSLLIAVLMHASYIFSTLFVLAPPTQGVPFLVYSGIFTAVLWIVVAAVAISNHGHILRQPLHRQMA